MLKESPIVAPRRINKHEAARRLGVSLSCVLRLIESGELKTAPSLGKGRNVVIESSVDELVSRLTTDMTRAG